ncbi:MAG: cache domain-containing protein [Candidatus Dadabacteria bacterium]|nr:cache domain-containing protein [Candidatus Dadabacteria bacterium]
MRNRLNSLYVRSAVPLQHGSNASPRRFQKDARYSGIAAYLKLLVLASCVSMLLGANPSAAHDNPHPQRPVATTAKDVVLDREKLQDFVDHASLHLFATSSFTESLNLMNSFRVEGQWRSGSVYLILLTKKGGVYIHPGDREIEDQDWSKKLVGCNGESWSELVNKGAGCVKYAGQDMDSPAGYAVVTGGYFVPFSKPGSGPVVEKEFVLLGGLDYRPEPDSYATFEDLKDSLIDGFASTNPDIEDPERFRAEFERVLTPSIDAADVRTQSHMREFLASAFTFITASFEIELFDPVILRKIFRYDGGPWRSGSTYIYIMDEVGNVIFNAVNRNLEQTDLWNFEGEHKEGREEDYRFFIQRIIKAAQSRPEGNFVEYDWDNPNVEGDEPVNLDDPGGSSSKLGYAIQLPLDGEMGKVYVFGTGLYLIQEEEAVDESDSGCSLAGPDTEAGSATANLLAVMALLALALLSGIVFSTARRPFYVVWSQFN